MNTYILQKDLPCIPAGTEFIKDPTGYYYTPSPVYKLYDLRVPFHIVESNSEWFVASYPTNPHDVKAQEEFKKHLLDKPPLGLLPKYLHDEKRFEDIRNAMDRCACAGKVVPQEWIKEKRELLEAMKNRHDSTLANKEKIKNDAERFFHRSCDVMKIEIDKSAIYFQKGDEGFAFDAQYIFKKLAGL